MSKAETSIDGNEKVSILVPLRNEEKNAEVLVRNLKGLTHPSLEIVLLDDNSTDGTKELLYEAVGGDERFEILEGRPLPGGWSGKVHACWQLSQRATGDYLLFLDADVKLQPGTVQQGLRFLKSKKAGMITGFPKFPVTSLLERWLVPLQQFFVVFHLPIWAANHTTREEFTAAHGAFLFFSREAYEASGGHEGIRDSIVDDVHITRKVKAAGKRVVLCNVTDYVTCKMYSRNKEVWEGFTKNLFPGLNRSVPFVLMISLFYLIFYVFPLPLAIYGLWNGFLEDWNLLFFLPLVLTVLQKMWVNFVIKQRLMLALWMPAASGAFIALIFNSMMYGLRNKGYSWKGRTYS
ncbi:glycosyltransferase [Bacillus salacetis]|uniref:4,4'-diaponeurosporenoate glycosyltransferase n=2 Tax=Bacillus salacetis TaxID=2315464 RepID=A0A3A1R7Z2_9BACI|nr:glycosyltransferase [Bacillus salacetis]